MKELFKSACIPDAPRWSCARSFADIFLDSALLAKTACASASADLLSAFNNCGRDCSSLQLTCLTTNSRDRQAGKAYPNVCEAAQNSVGGNAIIWRLLKDWDGINSFDIKLNYDSTPGLRYRVKSISMQALQIQATIWLKIISVLCWRQLHHVQHTSYWLDPLSFNRSLSQLLLSSSKWILADIADVRQEIFWWARASFKFSVPHKERTCLCHCLLASLEEWSRRHSSGCQLLAEKAC